MEEQTWEEQDRKIHPDFSTSVASKPQKLNTLKDLNWFEADIEGEFPDFEIDLVEKCGCDEPKGEQRDIFNSPQIDGKKLILRDDLKQEAIKWIKELEKQEEEDKTGNPFMAYIGLEDAASCENLVNWIKHFFNLNDGDLK